MIADMLKKFLTSPRLSKEKYPKEVKNRFTALQSGVSVLMLDSSNSVAEDRKNPSSLIREKKKSIIFRHKHILSQRETKKIANSFKI